MRHLRRSWRDSWSKDSERGNSRSRNCGSISLSLYEQNLFAHWQPILWPNECKPYQLSRVPIHGNRIKREKAKHTAIPRGTSDTPDSTPADQSESKNQKSKPTCFIVLICVDRDGWCAVCPFRSLVQVACSLRGFPDSCQAVKRNGNERSNDNPSCDYCRN